MEYRQRISLMRAEKLSKNSFILNKKLKNEEISKSEKNSLKAVYRDVQRKQTREKEINLAPTISHDKLGRVIYKNLDWFVVSFLEINLLAVTYPLQTLKTRT